MNYKLERERENTCNNKMDLQALLQTWSLTLWVKEREREREREKERERERVGRESRAFWINRQERPTFWINRHSVTVKHLVRKRERERETHLVRERD